MTRGELLARLTAEELLDWRAFDLIEPIGEFRADYRAAQIAAMVANVQIGDPDKRIDPLDLMPFADHPRAPSRAERAEARKRDLAARLKSALTAKR